MNEVSGEEQLSSIELSHTPFWVRAYNLPLNYRNKEVALILSIKVGMFLSEDQGEFKWRRYLCFRVLINMNQPLRRGTLVCSKSNNSCWVYFKYERLPTFCYNCSCCGHFIKDCEKSYDNEEECEHGLQYRD